WIVTGEEQMHGLITALCERGQANGELRRDIPAREMADVIIGAFVATISQWVSDRADERSGDEGVEWLEERFLRACRLLADGAKAKPARPPARTKRQATNRPSS